MPCPIHDRAGELRQLIMPHAREVLATPRQARDAAFVRVRSRCYADALVLGQGHRSATQWASRVEVFTRAIVAFIEAAPELHAERA